MKPDVGELHKKYIENPPEGMTSTDIRRMSEDELLDMDYFYKSLSNISSVNFCSFFIAQKSHFPIK